jgi:uncharacterized membrane protein
MNWLFGLIGAVVGGVIADERVALGLVFGFCIAYLFSATIRQGRRIDRLEDEVAALNRVAPAAGAAVPPPMPRQPAPEPVPSPAPLPVAAREVAPGAAVFEAREPTRVDAMVAASEARAASAQEGASEAATAARTPPMPPRPPGMPPRPPRPPAQPDWFDRAGGAIKSWFTEGNVPVKIGILVLLFGVAAALRYAAAEGYFTLPIELRLALIAGAGLAGLAFGWRERTRKPAFGLSLQGGAIGVLLLTVFAAFKLYGLLPPMLAFALVVVLVAGSALLSVLQKNMWLAVLGFLGGYLAPVLISTGSSNHVALFSYYALLNAAVFAISWKQSWRLLNLIGFTFTFGVGAMWGDSFYTPEKFATVEPFLVLFFAFYIAIGLMYVQRQTEHRRPWVDGTLVFGTPLVAFPLQAAMLKDDRMGLALSAIVVSIVYAGLVWWLRQRRGERLLTEAYGALALGFATLAVPLAFDSSATACVWALEGAGAAWIGLRQQRTFPWLAGLALQLLAAGSYCIHLFDSSMHASGDALLLLNAEWWGAALLAFSGFALSLIHDRHKPRFALPPLLFAWAAGWWLVSGLTQFDLAQKSLGEWRFAILYLSVSMGAAALLRDKLPWPRLNWMVGAVAVLALFSVYGADDEYGAPLAPPTLLPWAVYALAWTYALWTAAGKRARSLAAAHLAGLWTLALAGSMQMKDFVDDYSLAEGWEFLAVLAPVALMTLLLWRRPRALAWPRAEAFAHYRLGWFGLAVPVLAYAFAVGLFLEGSPSPLAYVPLLNPLELALLGIAALGYGLAGDFAPTMGLRRAWPVFAFAFVTMATLRAVHHLHGEPWSMQVLDSGFTQTALTMVWSLLGVGAWVVGSRRVNRAVWIGGLVLMLIVLAKLALVDRTYMGNLPGIVSFIAVGLLLVGVGWIAPSPPRTVPKLVEAKGEA